MSARVAVMGVGVEPGGEAGDVSPVSVAGAAGVSDEPVVDGLLHGREHPMPDLYEMYVLFGSAIEEDEGR